jgi:hypothetical protein
MHEINETPRNVLVAALFCAIIGIIVYAGFDSSANGQKARSLLFRPGIAAIHDDARQVLP